MKINNNLKIAVMGLGYVGLPLFTEMSKKFNVFGFDTDKKKIKDLKNNVDVTGELSSLQLKNLNKNKIFSQLNKLENIDVFIVTVPTPINIKKKPDLSILHNVTKDISKVLKNGSIVIYESTVYPGVTEEFCVPILEKFSGMKWKRNFNVGYTPERINPGDKKHTFTKISKVVSGDTIQTRRIIKNIYSKVVKAKIFEAESIKVAEAAKVIENTQRDLNIALMNELSIVFKKMNIKIDDVLSAAKTKWNFNLYHPGFVGGHCIGVDPYYLTYKSKNLGYNPKVILAGRKINDNMAKYAAKEIIKILQKKSKKHNIRILILGYTFKENCPDYRNTQVNKIKNYLLKKYKHLDIYDPYILNKLDQNFLIKFPNSQNLYDAIIIAVPHDKFLKSQDKILKLGKKDCFYFDLKSKFNKIQSKWSL